MGRIMQSVFLITVFSLIISGCRDVDLRTYLTRMTDFEGILYVSIETGDDSNRGVLGSPLKTIQAGINMAQDYITDGLADSVDVHVAKGLYSIASNQGESIVMVEGVSLYGGYSSDFLLRDTTLYTVTVSDSSMTGEDNATIRAYDGLTEITVIDGFTVIGGGGTGMSAGIDIERASPTIRNNTIIGGSSGEYCQGIDCYDNAMPLIENNIIRGGSSSNYNYGVIITDSSNPIIQNNSITGGSEGRCLGLFFWNTQGTARYNTISGGTGSETTGVYIAIDSQIGIYSNRIDGGTAQNTSIGVFIASEMVTVNGNSINGGSSPKVSYGISCVNDRGYTIENNVIIGSRTSDPVEDSAGIQCHSSSGTIANNTIAGGPVDWSGAIILMKESLPEIVNNILFSWSPANGYCIYESDNNTSSPSYIGNNDFWDINGSTVLYRKFDSSSYDTEALINALPHCTGNEDLDPRFKDIDGPDNDISTMDDNDWSLSVSSPLNVRQGGIDASLWANIDDEDRDRNKRTDFSTGPDNGPDNIDAAGWSMGAYEQD